jgi:signal transduction histidine kinase
VYLFIIATVIILFSYLVVQVVSQREVAHRLPPQSQILLSTDAARAVAQEVNPESKILKAEYELKNGILFYEVYFDDTSPVYVNVFSGGVSRESDIVKAASLYDVLTDDTYEVVAWLGLIVFLLASIGSIVVANLTLQPIAESVQKQKRFVSDAAHELRNPLASLQITLESYHRSNEKTVKLSETVVEDLLSEVKRLITTSESLLAFESHEKRNGKKGESLVSESLITVLSRLETMRHEKQISINQNISSQSIPMLAQDFDTVLYNLLHNAIKFSPEQAKINVTWDGKSLKVSDTGQGIDSEHLPHIYERFYKADQSRAFSTNSSGLGLALVYEIVVSYGGQISVRSVVGEGTTFIVSF